MTEYLRMQGIQVFPCTIDFNIWLVPHICYFWYFALRTMLWITIIIHHWGGCIWGASKGILGVKSRFIKERRSCTSVLYNWMKDSASEWEYSDNVSLNCLIFLNTYSVKEDPLYSHAQLYPCVQKCKVLEFS